MAYIELKNNTKIYQSGYTTIYTNKDITFSIDKGELVVILGSSGAGKSTLLNILGGMEPNTSGDVIVAGKNITSYNAKQLTTYRRNNVGFVFQFYNLIPNLTAKENVELAAQIVPDAMNPDEALREVDLTDREQNFPAQLSGGEQQRVAIARAIAKKPELLLCDEPTGALDYKTGKRILKILQDMSRKNGSTVLIVTHNAAIAPIADKVIRIHDGGIQKIETNDHPADISSIEW
ncbi:putative ABC transporter ATP-binding protein [Lactobacillus helveticus]|uniref:Macrolide ABC superfamily ATP binding cassette transporter, ATP-binding/permease protein n=2 Tax=Lactobacillus helveticus TaxID=1587 RepID=U4QNV1_LACHE|nr:ABC transporter ATP-binding protein [Lactobacillus helveticus]ALI53382.1 macrolide ABC transporter ATP-binding protein [Lactobacillus helveticus]NRN72461.1 putative ABC transporter ATP-binding protein [Lactobacillus helveticus]NRO12528.1 putative ABC transporter ATP-binding protein [Lactobacillus helveticus]NRO18260.1 putative ABC transporter ATP-binding protein [Lactobacillus helveticus]NRO77578.1 putative ABC transporter ATP-binding protein [Lactobacillus helveticus]